MLNTIMDIFSFTSCVLKLQAQSEDGIRKTTKTRNLI